MDSQELNKHTQEDLKDMCDARNLKAVGDKPTLIARILEHEKTVRDSAIWRKSSTRMVGSKGSHTSRTNQSLAELPSGSSHHAEGSSHHTTGSSYHTTGSSHQTGGSSYHIQQALDSLDGGGGMNAPKARCNACSSPIRGQVIIAMGHSWHPEHFLCFNCSEPLHTDSFFEHNGKPYCNKDYQMLYSPRCASCKGAITHNCITALGKQWHQEHFVCDYCGVMITQKSFNSKDGKAYCRTHYESLFSPKCARCHKDIVGSYITAVNNKWHEECFVCYDCQTPLKGKTYYNHLDFPHCENCNWAVGSSRRRSIHKKTSFGTPFTSKSFVGRGAHNQDKMLDEGHEGREIVNTNTSKNIHTAIDEGKIKKFHTTTTTFRYSDGSTREVINEEVENLVNLLE